MSQRAAPFFCPYCGEQDLEPVGEGKTIYCASCDRRFDLTFVGVGDS